MGGSYTDRATKQTGAPALKDPAQFGLVMNAEVKDIPLCLQISLCCFWRQFDKGRSYLYVRENSIEQNFAVKVICCPACAMDNISVEVSQRSWPFTSPSILYLRLHPTTTHA